MSSITRKEFLAVGFTMAASFFTIMGYELIRPASTVLFKQVYGVGSLPIALALMPLGVLLGVYIYARLLSWLGAKKTLIATTLGAGVIFLLAYWGINNGLLWLTGLLFIVKEFYIVILVEQFWSFINSSISEGTARKLNGPILGSSAIAGASGGFLAFGLAEHLGTLNLLLLTSVFLLPTALFGYLAHQTAGEPKPRVKEKSDYLGLHHFKRHPLLLFLLGIVISTQIFSTLIELRFQEILSEQFYSLDAETAFQGRFYGSLQVFILVVQFIITPLLLSRWKLNIGTIQLFIPCIHIATCVFAIIYPSLFTIGLSLFLFKAIDYSMFRATKEILYIPFSFDIRYRAKEFIDVFGYRFAKGATSTLLVGIKQLGIAVSQFYLLGGLFAALLWMGFVFPLMREIKKEKNDTKN